MSGKAASPLSPVIARLRAAGARVGHLPEHNPTSRLKPWLAYAVTRPNGTRVVVRGHGHDYRDIIATLEHVAAGLEAGTDPGTPSSSPGRSYTIGCPVTITLNDDGSVSVVVYLGEAGEGVADDVDYDDFGREIPNPHQDDDVARIMAAIDAGHVTTTHSKGA